MLGIEVMRGGHRFHVHHLDTETNETDLSKSSQDKNELNLEETLYIEVNPS